jgi:hypothetical protein
VRNGCSSALTNMPKLLPTSTCALLVAKLHGVDPEPYLAEVLRVMPVPPERYVEPAHAYWVDARHRLDPVEIAAELGPQHRAPAVASAAEQSARELTRSRKDYQSRHQGARERVRAADSSEVVYACSATRLCEGRPRGSSPGRVDRGMCAKRANVWSRRGVWSGRTMSDAPAWGAALFRTLMSMELWRWRLI